MGELAGVLCASAVVGFITGMLSETLRSVWVFLIGLAFIFYIGIFGILSFIPAVIYGIVLVEKEN